MGSERVTNYWMPDLVDGLRLMVHPVLLGKSKRLFDAQSRPTAFKLESSRTSPSGVLTGVTCVKAGCAPDRSDRRNFHSEA